MIATDRLLLRRWRPSDRALFAALNADPRVMECFPSTLTTAESDAMVDRIEAHFEEKGFGLWAVEVPRLAEFIGFIGLSTPRFTAHFTPCVEIGWRLAYEHWGYGFATEGAKAVLGYGFNTLKLPEIVAMTAVGNQRSRNVMEKLGMTHDSRDDFDHPLLPAGHPITPHVLYRMQNTQYLQAILDGIDAFVDSGEEGSDWLFLRKLLEWLDGLPGCEQALEPLFQLLERNAESDLGSPGPVVNAIEGIGNYDSLLQASLRRRPTYYTVWMVNRILNTLSPAEMQPWLTQLQQAAKHPKADDGVLDSVARFIEYQRAKSG